MNRLKILSITAAFFLTAASAVSAQDLIARQAPVDRKLKSIDSLVLKKQIDKEAAEYAAIDIYPSWNNSYAHVYGGVPLPENFRIDLRGFSMPTTNRVITSRYGYRSRWRRQHQGLDIDVNVGDTIYAAFDGKVRVVKYERGGYGKYLVIRHPNGLETFYAHMSAWLVEPNEEVKSGQPIGLGGNTGRSTGSHLHFEVRVLSKSINPELLFDFPNQDITADYYVFNPVAPKGETSLTAQGGTAGEKAKSESPASPYYKVRKGDSLYKIAKRYGITVEKLCELNGLTKRSILQPGLVLRCS